MTAADEALDIDKLTRLVGVPYLEGGRSAQGADCWGIVLLGAHHLFGLELPEYFYTRDQLLDQAGDLIARETTGPRWDAVDAPFPGGAVHIFLIRGAATHCGLHLRDSLFLHSLPGRNSCIESLDDMNWRQRRTGSYVLR